MENFNFDIDIEIKEALESNRPVVALESTLISHGLPYPKNLEVAKASIDAVKLSGALPATIAIINGKVKVGLNENDMNILAKSKNIEKVSRHNLAIPISNQTHAATTVASSIYLAALVGIKFFIELLIVFGVKSPFFIFYRLAKLRFSAEFWPY